MKFLFEIGLFSIILSIAVVLCAFAVWIFALPFQFKFLDSIVASVVAFTLLFPAAANFWGMVRGCDGESIGERIVSGVRGIGMLLCAVTIIAGIDSKSIPFFDGMPLLAVGFLLIFGTIPLDIWIRHRQNNGS